jgi:hypothetical protein
MKSFIWILFVIYVLVSVLAILQLIIYGESESVETAYLSVALGAALCLAVYVEEDKKK